MLNPELVTSFRQMIQSGTKFAIISHVRPDGDAYGSSLGLGLSLRAAGKDVLIVNADGMISSFRFLPGADTLETAGPKAPEADRLLIAVDCADVKRLGAAFDQWARVPDINIDHHVSNPGYAALNLVDAESPATAQVLHDLIAACGLPLTAGVASNLYVGIMTDTGSFRYRQTTARTFEVAAQLVAAGADPTALAEGCFQSFRRERLLLLKEVLNSVHFASRDRIAWFHLSPESYARSGANSEETEGLIEYLQSVSSVEVAFVLEQMSGGLTRASLRSRGAVDVQKICATFGGGGHRLAAGLRTKLEPAVLEKKLLDLMTVALPA